MEFAGIPISAQPAATPVLIELVSMVTPTLDASTVLESVEAFLKLTTLTSLQR
jgi:hypothetical protein